MSPFKKNIKAYRLPELVKNCRVILKDDINEKKKVWRVQHNLINEHGEDFVAIVSHGNHRKVARDNIACGFQTGAEVIEYPDKSYLSTLGIGKILGKRILAGSEQLLVEFVENGEIHWLPYFRLSQIKGVQHRCVTGDTGDSDSAERFRLKNLSYAIEMWNENTGALSDLDIDPLPHQINLVHHILASGDLNWLIADDVGLGKTIETGMLLSALLQRNSLKRVLLVTPAGLTKQWQEELELKFKLDQFQILGQDFQINNPKHWKLHDFVIASIDRLKDDRYLDTLKDSGEWDLIIFDEAHRLSRRQYGMKFEISDRFKLARELRKYTESFILLSATPHQGMQDKFTALLELLHPERVNEIRDLELNPSIINEMVFRNNKADVVNLEGELIFKGKTTKSIPISSPNEFLDFDLQLKDYLKKGYSTKNALMDSGKRTGAAIGFVMTVYRKLAASSISAIHDALVKRHSMLTNFYSSTNLALDDISTDERFEGEEEESLRFIEIPDKEFFVGELDMLSNLISSAKLLMKNDFKLNGFIDNVIASILQRNINEKILIFTEYKSTQKYLKNALEKQFGLGCVELINGSLNLKDRGDVIHKFKYGDVQFLISTEAGGEGINLQNNCHILINYDLPWNPMRLVQRIGRLYRYGQEKNVVIFNLHSSATEDENILKMMYSRLDQVVEDLAGVSSEFNSSLHDDILGDIASITDVYEILVQSVNCTATQTKEQIERALEDAKEATRKQRELFQYASTFDKNELTGQLSITIEHCWSFILGMLNIYGIDIINESHNGKVIEFKLSEELLKEFGGKKSNFVVTVDRSLARKSTKTEMMDLNHPLMLFLLAKAQEYQFGGMSTVVINDADSAYLTGLAYWQNIQGTRKRREFITLGLTKGNLIEANPIKFSQFLLHKTHKSNQTYPNSSANAHVFKMLDTHFEDYMEYKSNNNLYPENKHYLSIARCE